LALGLSRLFNSCFAKCLALLQYEARTYCLRRREGIFEPGGALALAPGAKAYCRYYGMEDDVSFMPEDRVSFKTLAEKGALGQWFWFALASCEGRWQLGVYLL